MPTYAQRKAVNEKSRDDAENYQERWSEDEVQRLEENWSIEGLEALAAQLGRTVEACRQKHYDLNRVRDIKKSSAPLSAWTRGFTSLDEMGY